MTDDKSQQARKWFDEAEEALDRAAEALKSAWDETRDVRMSTLEAAKEAANRLGTAIDQGIEAARQSWDQTPAGETSAADPEKVEDRLVTEEEE
jgi:hypothetical protein